MLQNLFAAAMERLLAGAAHPKKLVSALSGGMDSVVLLHLLASWRDAGAHDVDIVAAHLNHGLRGIDSLGDQEFSRRLAESLGVAYADQEVDAARVAVEERLGVEEAGRMLRYRFFHDLVGSDGLVLTGHHADDQAETVLMNLRRGAHRRGLSGMRELSVVPVPPGVRVRIGRPLLAVGRESLQAYALENSLEWREDASNLDPSYMRNRVRHRVIPMLEKILPGFRERLLEKSEQMAREEAALVERGRRLAEKLSRREAGGRFLRVHEAALAEPERFIYALRHVVEEEMGCRIPHGASLSRLAELAESGRLGEVLSLPARLRVRREPDGLFFFFPDRDGDAEPEEILLPDPPFRILADGLEVTAEWMPVFGPPPAEDMADSEVEWLDPAAIRWPLRLRAPRPGERFRPLGAPGSRKIQDILVDLKTPRRKRSMARVVADHAGALWLWPYRLANRARLTPATTRALRLRITEAATS